MYDSLRKELGLERVWPMMGEMVVVVLLGELFRHFGLGGFGDIVVYMGRCVGLDKGTYAILMSVLDRMATVGFETKASKPHKCRSF